MNLHRIYIYKNGASTLVCRLDDFRVLRRFISNIYTNTLESGRQCKTVKL